MKMTRFGALKLAFFVLLAEGICERTVELNLHELNTDKCSYSLIPSQRIKNLTEKCQNEINSSFLNSLFHGEFFTVPNTASYYLAPDGTNPNAERPQIHQPNGYENLFRESFSRIKREIYDKNKQILTGCSMYCTLVKLRGVDARGVPTHQGVLDLLTDGVYLSGQLHKTAEAITQCYLQLKKELLRSRLSYPTTNYMCDFLFELHYCVINKMISYCIDRQ